MKKIILLAFCVLAACATTDNGNGLNRFDKEPTNCKYLYTMDSSATSYKLAGAYDYLEQTILDQRIVGDSYFVVEQSTKENPDAVFGPKNTFKFKVKVYNCAK